MLHIATFNIHKGFSPLNRQLTVHELRDCLRRLGPDIVFLQEVQGAHALHSAHHPDWPATAQHHFLAEDVWPAAAYGRNMVYDHGHHGNAILSRFAIVDSHNQDVTRLRFERRGLLHCRIALPDGRPLHCVCVHFSLFARSRRRQMADLCAHLQPVVDSGVPLIIAGDFNDWQNQADRHLARRLGLTEVFGAQPVRSFPARLPVLRRDRSYVRGLAVLSCACQCGPPWSQLSDHAALSARLAYRA